MGEVDRGHQTEIPLLHVWKFPRLGTLGTVRLCYITLVQLVEQSRQDPPLFLPLGPRGTTPRGVLPVPSDIGPHGGRTVSLDPGCDLGQTVRLFSGRLPFRPSGEFPADHWSTAYGPLAGCDKLGKDDRDPQESTASHPTEVTPDLPTPTYLCPYPPSSPDNSFPLSHPRLLLRGSRQRTVLSTLVSRIRVGPESFAHPKGEGPVRTPDESRKPHSPLPY